MKNLSIILVVIILGSFIFIGCGQTGSKKNELKSKKIDAPGFISFRPDMKLVLDTIDLRKFIGQWKSLNDDSTLIIKQKDLDFSVSGVYFPGVSNYGDKAILSFSGRLGYVMNQGKRVQTNISQGGATVGYKVSLELKYENSRTHGGGGSGIAIAYSPEKDHLIVGKPPYNVYENGRWTGHCGTFASNGIYGKEFERMKITDNKDNTEGKLVINLQNNEYGGPGQITFSKKGKTLLYFVQKSQTGIIQINGTKYILNNCTHDENSYKLSGNEVKITASNVKQREGSEGADCIESISSNVIITLSGISTSINNVDIGDCLSFSLN